MSIKTTSPNKSRISEVDLENLQFGRVFSDHMFEMIWQHGQWQPPEIRPYGKISFTPGLNVLHYGQSIFEGMKAYYVDNNTIHLFRPKDHHERFNRSAERMCIPTVEYDVFISALEQLLKLDAKWVPKKMGRALYVRPHVFASEECLAARASMRYHFYIITSPVAAYYKEGVDPVSLTTREGYVRAVRGGTGEAKAAGNYAASFYPAQKAQEEGYTQVLWLDAVEHKYIEEVGTMNIFFMINGKLITPQLSGSVLNGITRRSVIELGKSWGLEVEERRITIGELFEASEAGKVGEVFGTGTAAVISPVKLIHHKGRSISISNNQIGPVAKKLYETITGIQYGEIEDTFGWTHKVKVDGIWPS